MFNYFNNICAVCVAHQVPLPIGFPRQEYWSGLPVPTPGHLPNPGKDPVSIASPPLADGFFTTVPPGKPFNNNASYGLPRWFSGKESACQHRRLKSFGINPWVRKISWRRKWQPALVFLPEKSHEQRDLVGYRFTKSQTQLNN